MDKEKKVTIAFDEAEILNIMDWFNGYISKYYGSDPEIINQKLPDNHKKLIDKILEKYEAEFSVMLSDEELEALGLKQEAE